MKVKPFLELATILDRDPDYKVSNSEGQTAFHHKGEEGKESFLFEMFECCGKNPNSTRYSWEPGWLDESPEDCVGKICSVWDEYEPKDKTNRSYQLITGYDESITFCFKTPSNTWKYARPLTEKDLI